jgi:hypothetical protein
MNPFKWDKDSNLLGSDGNVVASRQELDRLLSGSVVPSRASNIVRYTNIDDTAPRPGPAQARMHISNASHSDVPTPAHTNPVGVSSLQHSRPRPLDTQPRQSSSRSYKAYSESKRFPFCLLNRKVDPETGYSAQPTAVPVADGSWLPQDTNFHHPYLKQPDFLGWQGHFQLGRGQHAQPSHSRSNANIAIQTESLPPRPRSTSQVKPTLRDTTEHPYSPDSQARPSDSHHTTSATSLHAPYMYANTTHIDDNAPYPEASFKDITDVQIQALPYTGANNGILSPPISDNKLPPRPRPLHSKTQIASHSMSGGPGPQLNTSTTCKPSLAPSDPENAIDTSHADNDPGKASEDAPSPEASAKSGDSCLRSDNVVARLSLPANLFADARVDLERLRTGIDSLEDRADSASSTGRSGSETASDVAFLSHTDDDREDHEVSHSKNKPGVDSGPNKGQINWSPGFSTNATATNEDGSESHGDHPTSTVDRHRHHDSNSSDTGQSHKRQRTFDALDGEDTRGDIMSSEKRPKLTCKRFKCCFENGPGRKCAGTDESILDVIRKLSEQHDIRICDRCWVLKVKHEPSGFFEHPDDSLECQDHCLSPQCHGTAPTIGSRHIFDQRICKTKTSRVRPRDSEAVYRFIHQLVHPSLEVPAEVFTSKHAGHLDSVARQGRRKPTREELAAQADALAERLEEGDRQMIAKLDHINQLERKLAEAHDGTEREKGKVVDLEAQMSRDKAQSRKIVAMLGDALRTGTFTDRSGHLSLLGRVEEDAPNALSYLQNCDQTPPRSASSQQPSEIPARCEVDIIQNSDPNVPKDVGSLGTPHDTEFLTQATQFSLPEVDLVDQEMNSDWFNLIGGSGNVSNVSTYMDGFS